MGMSSGFAKLVSTFCLRFSFLNNRFLLKSIMIFFLLHRGSYFGRRKNNRGGKDAYNGS